MTFRDLVNWDRSTTLPIHRGDRFDHPLISLRDDMNRLFQDFWGEDYLPWYGGPSFPAIDVIENDEDITVKAEVFGMEPDNIDVSIKEDCLIIKGERKE